MPPNLRGTLLNALMQQRQAIDMQQQREREIADAQQQQIFGQMMQQKQFEADQAERQRQFAAGQEEREFNRRAKVAELAAKARGEAGGAPIQFEDPRLQWGAQHMYSAGQDTGAIAQREARREAFEWAQEQAAKHQKALDDRRARLIGPLIQQRDKYGTWTTDPNATGETVPWAEHFGLEGLKFQAAPIDPEELADAVAKGRIGPDHPRYKDIVLKPMDDEISGLQDLLERHSNIQYGAGRIDANHIAPVLRVMRELRGFPGMTHKRMREEVARQLGTEAVTEAYHIASALQRIDEQKAEATRGGGGGSGTEPNSTQPDQPPPPVTDPGTSGGINSLDDFKAAKRGL